MVEPDPTKRTREDEASFQFGKEVKQATEDNDQQKLDELAEQYKRRNK